MTKSPSKSQFKQLKKIKLKPISDEQVRQLIDKRIKRDIKILKTLAKL